MEKDFIVKVLIVDDEEGMRLGAKRCLSGLYFKDDDFSEKIKFDVFMAACGEEAISAIKEIKPDLVVLDYKLPDMTGLEVLEKFDNPSFLSIIITAFSSLEVAIAATKKGAFDFLSKPFTPEELRQSVKKASKNIFALKKAISLREEKKQIRFEFVSVLAHELKSPLAAIEGYMSLIEERIKGEELASYDDMINRSVERINSMRKLINDILDLTRLESGKKKRVLEEIDLFSSANYAAEGFKKKIQEKSLSFSLDCDKSLRIFADKSEIEMLFSNFISNAVKYNKPSGFIKLSIIKDESGFFEISCEDSGIGMTEDDLKKIFNEFVRIKNEHTRSIEGSGLGLSIIKKICAIYGGDITVESQYNKGTLFKAKIKEASRAVLSIG